MKNPFVHDDPTDRSTRTSAFALRVSTAPLLALLVALSSTLDAQSLDTAIQTSYRSGSLTDTPRTFTNLNREVTQGFFITDTLEVYAINSYGSTLNHYNLLDFLSLPAGAPPELDPDWRVLTLNNPAALVEGSNSDMFVVGGSTYGVARYDLSGNLLAFAKVGDEPGSAIVDSATGSAA